MRSLLSVALSLFLASSVGLGSLVSSAAALEQRSDTQCLGEVCPSVSAVFKRDSDEAPCYDELTCFSSVAKRDSNSVVTPSTTINSRVVRKDLTNAQRLARGLGIKPPVRRGSASSNAARSMPSSHPKKTHTGVIQVFSGATSLGFVAPDPNYWTPLLTPDINGALKVSFELHPGATSGSRLTLMESNDGRGPIFGPVVGRDSTSSNIAPGSFNYLYFDPTSSPGTAPGATPQSIPSYFSTSSGLDKQAETSVWSVDLVTNALSLQWINTDNSTPATLTFLQSNHLYAGGDPSAFQGRFPAPVTSVTLKFIPA